MGRQMKRVAVAAALVFPLSVTLSCGCAYESGLIAQSFRTAIPAVRSFAATLALCNPPGQADGPGQVGPVIVAHGDLVHGAPPFCGCFLHCSRFGAKLQMGGCC